jgi:hypothetical protein
MEKRERAKEYLARKGDGTMSSEDFNSVVKMALSQCVQFVDEELSQDRATATDYYNGKPFGNEEEGRSQVVLTEVADAVDGMIPGFMRVAFPAGEHAVEFVPTRADTVAMAEQQTDYVRYVIEQDNQGFLRVRDVYHDGLVRKLGIFKWWWDESEDTKAYTQEGISRDQLEMLASDDEVEFTSIAMRDDGMYDADLTRTQKGGRACIDSVPPEEFLFNRQARRLDKAIIVAHRTEKTRGQLIAMGVKGKDIDAHAGAGEGSFALRGNAEEIARLDTGKHSSGSGFNNDPELGKANDKILYTEAWMTVDYDGDGVAELRRICTIGTTYYPVKNVPTDEIPFSVFTPYPEPHTLLGRSVYDKTGDMQKINSQILRGILDSMALSLFPRMAYLDGQASVADIMNTAIGAPMRERVTGAIRPVVVPFTGGEMMPVLAFTQEVIERRTGKPKGAAGLDADALQSTGKEAVSAVLGGSQEQSELVARIFCEMALKPLYLGVGKMLATHQPRARVVKLRGNWAEVNPRSWDMNMDVTVNVALGSSFTEKKIATLMSVAADQKEIMTNMGVDNPVVTLPMLVNTRRKILALQGIKDADNYYKQLPPDWKPPAPPQPQPSPDELWIQAEKEMNHKKTMKELAIKADELQLKREEQEWQHGFEERKLAADVETKKYIADAANTVTASAAELSARIDEEAREADLAIQAHGLLHDQHLARDKHEHDKAMAVRAADTADAQATVSDE